MKTLLVIKWTTSGNGATPVPDEAVRPVEEELSVQPGSFRAEYVPVASAYDPFGYIQDRIDRGLELAGILFPLPSDAYRTSFDALFLGEGLHSKYKVPIYGYLDDGMGTGGVALRFVF
ncbi:MAG: hypothetical protein WC243_03155 [Patescibacteria group bacterium]